MGRCLQLVFLGRLTPEFSAAAGAYHGSRTGAPAPPAAAGEIPRGVRPLVGERRAASVSKLEGPGCSCFRPGWCASGRATAGVCSPAAASAWAPAAGSALGPGRPARGRPRPRGPGGPRPGRAHGPGAACRGGYRRPGSARRGLRRAGLRSWAPRCARNPVPSWATSIAAPPELSPGEVTVSSRVASRLEFPRRLGRRRAYHGTSGARCRPCRVGPEDADAPPSAARPFSATRWSGCGGRSSRACSAGLEGRRGAAGLRGPRAAARRGRSTRPCGSAATPCPRLGPAGAPGGPSLVGARSSTGWLARRPPSRPPGRSPGLGGGGRGPALRAGRRAGGPGRRRSDGGEHPGLGRRPGRRCRRTPVLVLDDLQTPAPGDRELLEALVEAFVAGGGAGARLILVARPPAPWRRDGAFRDLPEIRVAPMGPEEMERFGDAACRGLPLPSEIVARFSDQAAGLPFAFEEGLAALAERDLVHEVHGSLLFRGGRDAPTHPSARLVAHTEAEMGGRGRRCRSACWPWRRAGPRPLRCTPPPTAWGSTAIRPGFRPSWRRACCGRPTAPGAAASTSPARPRGRPGPHRAPRTSPGDASPARGGAG